MKKPGAKAAPRARIVASHPGDQAQPVAWFVWYCSQATSEADAARRERFAARMLLPPRPRRAAGGGVPAWNPEMVEHERGDADASWQIPASPPAPERDTQAEPPERLSMEVDLADLDRSDAAEARIEAEIERAGRRAQARRRPNMTGGESSV